MSGMKGRSGGRNRLPVALHILNGTYRKDRHGPVGQELERQFAESHPDLLCPVCSAHVIQENRRFCSPECAKTGRRKPSARKRITLQCAQCGIPCERTPSTVRGRVFCSNACRLAQQSRANNPRWKRVCRGCGKMFTLSTSGRNAGKYCSRECSWKHGRPRKAVDGGPLITLTIRCRWCRDCGGLLVGRCGRPAKRCKPCSTRYVFEASRRKRASASRIPRRCVWCEKRLRHVNVEELRKYQRPQAFCSDECKKALSTARMKQPELFKNFKSLPTKMKAALRDYRRFNQVVDYERKNAHEERASSR